MLTREASPIVDALVADLGRGRTEAFLTDVNGVQREVATLRRNLRRWARDERVPLPLVLLPGSSWLRREPLGTVLVVGPWNYPVNLVLAPLAAGLAAGNCVVLKPSEQAPASSALVARLVDTYLDNDGVAVCEGGAEMTEALIDQGVDHIFFTGSPGVGRLVMARAAERLTPVTLELGGRCPVLVDATADLEVAARRIAWGKLVNAGQSCIAPNHVFVDARARDVFVEALQGAIEQMYGPDPAQSPDYGRIVSDQHVARLGRLLEGHGGRVAVGGGVDPGRRYVAPTVVVDPSPDSALMGEEIFGPVLPVVSVENMDEAVALVDKAAAPLALYLFSRDEAVAEQVWQSTRSGAACWNSTMVHFAASRLPFGGVGESGIGNYHGRHGYERLSHLRPVLHKPAWPDPRLTYPPFSARKAWLLQEALSLPGRFRDWRREVL